MAISFQPLLFSGLVLGSSGGSSSPTIGQPVVGADPNAILITDGSSNLADVVLSDGQILIGATGAAPVAASITGTAEQVLVTNGPNSITLSLPQNISPTSGVVFHDLTLTSPLQPDSGGTGTSGIPTAGQVLVGNAGGTYTKRTLQGTTNQVIVSSTGTGITFSAPQDIATTSNVTFNDILANGNISADNLILVPSGSIDISSTGTLAIGTSNANIINIGNSGATINIQGDTIYQNVTDLNVTDKNITINSGGSIGSASNAGLQVEEGGSITGYVETSADRNSWEILAPNTAGIITFTPGASGFTINQGSHDPVTIGTANGLSLSTQALSLALSSGSTTGALSSTDFNTFNNKQPAGNYITALTGDVSASGPGSSSATLATVNASPGTFGTASSVSTVTVNGKGLSTTIVETPIQIAESQVTNLVTDLAGKQPTGNYITALTGDATASGPGSATLTLATVNSNIGSFNTLTVNAKGLVTAASNTPYVTPIAGDIAPTTYSGLANNTANQSITGLTFATTINSFESLLNIQISATSNTWTTVKLLGTRKNASDWSSNDLQVEFTADSILGLGFNITSAGQVQISIGNISGFTSGTIKFRAEVL